MKATEDLFLLIKSLTKSEKRYFKVFAAKLQCDGPTDYLHLFDALEEMEHYDERKLEGKLEPRTLQYLPQSKYYLYKIILRSLNQYHSSVNTEARLDEMLHASRILYDKKLYSQCGKLLAKARKLAERSDCTLHLLRILKMEYRLVLLEPDLGKAEQDVEDLFDTMVCMGEKLRLEAALRGLLARLYLLTVRNPETPSADLPAIERQFLHDPAVREAEHSDDPFIRLLYLFIHEHFYRYAHRYEEGYRWGKALVGHIESEPTLRSKVIERYLPALHNLCMNGINAGLVDEVPLYFEKLKGAVAEAKEITPEYNDLMIRMLEPRLLMERGDLPGAARTLRTLESAFMEARGGLRIGFVTYFDYLFAYTSFGMGDYAGALRWLNNILNDRNVETNLEVQCQARILNLLVHYELGNLANLEFYLASAARFFAKHGRMQTIYPRTATMIRGLLAAAGPSEVRACLAESYRRFIALRDDPDQARAMFYIHTWIESKLQGKSYWEMIAPPDDLPPVQMVPLAA